MRGLEGLGPFREREREEDAITKLRWRRGIQKLTLKPVDEG